MRRVCCFCERWESGGIESFLCNVLTRMDLTNLEIDIVASSIGESIFTEPLRQHGVNFLELSGSQRNILENHRQFRRLMKKRHYDVLHLNAFHGLSLAYLHIAKQEGIPIRIAHSHNTALRASMTKPIKLAIHKYAKERFTQDATDLWACSKNAAEFLFAQKELQVKRFKFIPNGIDTERFRFAPEVRAKVRAELGIENSFVIGNVGRLCYQKNQSFLLDVLVEALKQNSNVILILIGDGEDKPKLIKKAEDLHITNKIIFYGTTDHPQNLFWAMDVFALPSRFEGLPVTGVEAQAASLPVVYSDRITSELNITKTCISLPLDAGPERWATALLTTHHFTRNEMDVVGAGFDVKAVAQSIESRFMGVSV